MTFPLVQFVAGPDADAAVRFDFNAAGQWADEDTWPDHDGFSLGTPAFEGARDAVGVQYGPRQLTFNLCIKGSKQAAALTLSALAKELVRRSNWLRFQLSAFQYPVWFRTYQTAPSALSFENLINSRDVNLWGVGVAVDAEPFAYGALVTLPAVTVKNDPSTGPNPTTYILPTVIGDAPAGVRMRITPVREAQTAFVSLLACDTQPTAPVFPTLASVGADSTNSASATSVGGSLTAISFTGTPGMADRIVYSGPSVRHGTYKVLARMYTGSPPSVYTIRLSNQYTPAKVLTSTTVTGLTTVTQWVDLGVIDWPVGAIVDGAEFLPVTSSTFSATLSAQRVSGAGSLNIDCLMLVPIDVDDGTAETMTVVWPASEASPDAVYVDTDSRSVRLVTSGDQPLQASVPAQVMGAFPHVTPGAVNVLRLLATYSATAPGDALTTTATVTVSYHPRWLYLADS